jgi:hypothetical protein
LASAGVSVAIACGGFTEADPAPEPVPGAAVDGSTVDGPDETSSMGPNDAGADAPCTSCAPTSVAPEIPHPYRIAASAGALYWSDFTKDLWTCDPAACVPQVLGGDGGTLLKSHLGATSASVDAIDTTCSSVNDRTAGEYVYLRASGVVTARGVACPQFVSTHGDRAYFTNSGTLGAAHSDWSVTRCEADGGCVDLVGGATPLGFGVLLFAVATDTKIVGAMSSGTLVQWDNVVGANATITSEALSTTFRDVATDGARVFWLDATSVRGCEVAKCAATASTVASDATAQVLAADATGLYWTSKGSGAGDGKVMWLARGATAAVAIATGQVSPVGIALDAKYVYWANDRDASGNVTKGSILRRSKPM